MNDTAKKAVDVGATLAKYGIMGAGYVAGCGIRLGKSIMQEVGNLAAEFSGCKIGSNIGGFMLGEGEKIATHVVNGAEKLSIAGINYIANRMKSRL